MHTQYKIEPHAAQKNLIILEKMYRGSSNNHHSVAVDIDGVINDAALKSALLKMYKRHEMLRSTIQTGQNNPVFIIRPEDDIDESQLPFTSLAIKESHPTPSITKLSETLNSLGDNSFLHSPFDLEHGPLWRAVLVKTRTNHYQFAMLFNHLIIDESSVGILLKDLSAYYNAELLQDPSLIPDPIPSQATLSFSPSDQDERLSFWQNELKDLNTLTLQTDHLPQQSFNLTGKRYRFTLDKHFISQLEQFSTAQGCSINQVMLAGLYTLLYRYSGETDICVGIPSANRMHPNISEQVMSGLVNCFFNSVPLRLSAKQDITFTELAMKVNHTLGQTLKNQLPLDLIWEKAISTDAKEKFQTATPFNVLLVLKKLKPTLTLHGTEASQPIELDLGHSKFPYFGLNLDEQKDGSYECFIEYNTDLFTENSIIRIIEHFKQILEHATNNPDCKISTIPFLLEEEKRLISQFNDTGTDDQKVRFFPDYFHETALMNPSKTALVFHDDSEHSTAMTYEELDRKSNQLANYINSLDISSSKRIGICVSRSPMLVVAIIAVLKSSKTMVTLETEDSIELQTKTRHADLSMIITDDHTHHLFDPNQYRSINLDHKITSNQITFTDSEYHKPKLIDSDTAYIMHTSGTSGDQPFPKGVMIPHRSFANLITALEAEDIKPESKDICTAQPTFDAFLYDLLVAAVTQGELHLTNAENRYSPHFLETIITKHQLNYGVFLPNVLSQLNPQLPIDHVISMGAVPHEDTLRVWHQANPSRRIENGLGHTETGICLALERYLPGQDHTLVGGPIKNMQIYILNPSDLSLCPIGVPGEIYVAGPGLASGYLNNDALTQKKFPVLVYNENKCAFEAPNSSTPEENMTRLYATGDLACYQQVNNSLSIKFIGRNDRQIKLNGVRIDLEEIENIIRHHPLVKDIAIIPNQDNSALSAYIVPESNGLTFTQITQKIREFITTTHLSPVAFPKNYFVLPELPLTANGKVDRKKLPQPNLNTVLPIATLSQTQKTLLLAWQTVLNKPIDGQSIHCSFKALGGNSFSLANLEVALNSLPLLPLTKYIAIGDILSLHMTISSLEQKLTPFIKSNQNLIALGPNTYMNSGKITFYSPKGNNRPTNEVHRNRGASLALPSFPNKSMQ